MKRILAVLLLVGCSKGTPAVRLIPYAEAVDTYATNCNAPTQTRVTTPDGGAFPYAPLTGRRSITVCSDPRNDLILQSDGGAFRDGNRTPYITCTIDGTAPSATAGTGTVLGAGDCLGAALNYQQPVKCVTDTADAGLLSTECR